MQSGRILLLTSSCISLPSTSILSHLHKPILLVPTLIKRALSRGPSKDDPQSSGLKEQWPRTKTPTNAPLTDIASLTNSLFDDVLPPKPLRCYVDGTYKNYEHQGEFYERAGYAVYFGPRHRSNFKAELTDPPITSTRAEIVAMRKALEIIARMNLKDTRPQIYSDFEPGVSALMLECSSDANEKELIDSRITALLKRLPQLDAKTLDDFTAVIKAVLRMPKGATFHYVNVKNVATAVDRRDAVNIHNADILAAQSIRQFDKERSRVAKALPRGTPLEAVSDGFDTETFLEHERSSSFSRLSRRNPKKR